MKKFDESKIKSQFLKDLKRLVSIPSTPQVGNCTINAPFGRPIRECFDCFMDIAKEKGFFVEDDEGYAVSASLGEGKDYIGILGHLDIVDAGDFKLWDTMPYDMVEKDGVLYGRGVNDDKGPLLAALYALWLVKQQEIQLRYPVRIIAGGAEETTWECMEHYFKTHNQPRWGFSPDGNFPIVNGEKGILQVRFLFPPIKRYHITSVERINYVCDRLIVTDQHGGQKEYIGKRALSRNPQRGENAIFKFIKDHISEGNETLHDCIRMIYEQFLDDVHGEKSGLYHDDQDMGQSSVCVMSLTSNKDFCECCVDIRYVKSTNYETLIGQLEEIAKRYHATLNVMKHKRLLFVEEHSELIQGLKNAYLRVMLQEPEVLTKGGASYARVLDRGVAFGATFPNEDPRPHMPNECMPIASLMKACEIYYEAICELAK